MCSVGASRPRSQRQLRRQLPKPKLPPKLRLPLLGRGGRRRRQRRQRNVLHPRSQRTSPPPKLFSTVLPLLLRRSLKRMPSSHVPWTWLKSTSASPWNVIRWFWLYRCRFWCWGLSKSGEKSMAYTVHLSSFLCHRLFKRNPGMVEGHMAGLHVRSTFSSLVGGVGSL